MFAHFQDLCDGYVGPFDSVDDLLAHVEFCRERGDAAVYPGAVDVVPEGELVVSPAEDRAQYATDEAETAPERSAGSCQH